MKQNFKTKLDVRSKYLRKLILDAYTTARRGHFGSYLSVVEIIRVLYDDFLRYDPKKPKWIDRDRFILSKGHGSLGLYAVLADKGFFPIEKLKTFVQFDSMFGQHPDARKVPGVEASTGSLGHGLSIASGIATAAKIDKSKWRVYALISDGESQEGTIWEAALAIKKHNLTNLTILVDYNHAQSYGSSHIVLDLEPFARKWKSFGFGVQEVDGHNIIAIRRAIRNAIRSPKKPQIIICHTIKGKGIAHVENNMDWHHKVKLTDEEIMELYKGLDNRVNSKSQIPNHK